MDKNNDVINEKEEVPVTYFDTLKSKEVEWLWKPYIAFGKLTVLEGPSGITSIKVSIKLRKIKDYAYRTVAKYRNVFLYLYVFLSFNRWCL